MGLQIRCYVEGQQKYLDLYENENVSMETSFAEIQDITKKNSAYTKEFKIPGTNNNSDIFNYFFEINSVPLDWNPKRKFEASLIYNGYELYSGNIRLNMVTILKIEKVYSITFYAEVGDLSSNIGDKALCNVDTTSLDHSLYDYYTAQTLLQDPSLHPTSMIPSGATYWNRFVNPISNGDVQYILGQRGYDYTGSTTGTILDINTSQTPILDFSGVTGYFDNNRTPVIPPYLIPSIRTRKLYELIVNQADYTIESSFFDSDYFGRYYVPLSFNTESNYMAQSRPYDFLIENLTGTTGPNGGEIKLIGTGPYSNAFVFTNKDLIFDNLDFNPIDITNYNPDSTFTSPFNLSAATDYVIAIPQSYTQDQTLRLEYTYRWNGPVDPFGTTTSGGYVSVHNFWGSNTTGSIFQGVLEGNYGFFIDTSSSADLGVEITKTFDVPLCPYFTYNQTLFLFVSWTEQVNNIDILSVKLSMANNLQSLPYTIESNKEMDCTSKQIDFIQDVNRMFNLVVIPHPTKPKTLIIEPMVDWIGKGELLDWTSKVDFNSPQTLRPTTSLINGSIFAANKIDKDFVNTQFNNKSNKIYGQNIIDLGVDYKNEFTELTQRLGQNTDYYLNASGYTNIALPCYFISKESNNNGQSVFDYRPFRSLPRMVFKSVPLPSGNTSQEGYFLRLYDQTYSDCITYPSGTNYNTSNVPQTGDIPNINRLTTYPFAISGFSHYTVYDSELEFTPDELIYPDVPTQYDRYYKDYIDDLISEENKIYTCKMYLQPWEVAQLYSNEVILIKNAKFRINKITNLNLIEPDLCDVELVKLTRDYTPTPVLFFDLIDCRNECNIIHSHTDLNYLLWAFGTPNPNSTGTTEGKYVELITFFGPNTNKNAVRFKVIQTQYNPNYTYENVYFNMKTQNVASGGYLEKQIYYDYVMYDSCSASTPSYILDVVDNLSQTTESCDCVTMLVTNTGSTRESFTYTTCTGTTSSWSLDVDESISVCGCYDSFTQTGFTYCPELTAEPCTEPEPLCTECFEVSLTNNNAFECNITYYNCNTSEWMEFDMPPTVSIILPCACPEIITDCFNIDVSVGTPC